MHRIFSYTYWKTKKKRGISGSARTAGRVTSLGKQNRKKTIGKATHIPVLTYTLRLQFYMQEEDGASTD